MPLPPECALFEKDVGDWEVDIEVNTPQGPHSTTGEATSRLVGGGRWLVTDFRTKNGDFEGHGVYGYDPVRGYVGTWVDTMRPFLAVMEGRWDEATRTMTYTGEARMADRSMRWRETTTVVDAETQRFQNWVGAPDGSEMLVMTATWRRRR